MRVLKIKSEGVSKLSLNKQIRFLEQCENNISKLNFYLDMSNSNVSCGPCLVLKRYHNWSLKNIYNVDIENKDNKEYFLKVIEKLDYKVIGNMEYADLKSLVIAYFSLGEIYFLENNIELSKSYFTTVIDTMEEFLKGGTISGVGKKLKEALPTIVINGVEPESSPIISKGVSGPHKIQGIGAGFIPDIYLDNVVDKITTVTDEDALNTSLMVSSKEGLFLGPSSGAAIFTAISLAKTLGPGKKILVISPDGGEKYLSMDYINKAGSSND